MGWTSADGSPATGMGWTSARGGSATCVECASSGGCPAANRHQRATAGHCPAPGGDDAAKYSDRLFASDNACADNGDRILPTGKHSPSDRNGIFSPSHDDWGAGDRSASTDLSGSQLYLGTTGP